MWVEVVAIDDISMINRFVQATVTGKVEDEATIRAKKKRDEED